MPRIALVDIVLAKTDQQGAQRLDGCYHLPEICGYQVHVGLEQKQRGQVSMKELTVDARDTV